jgi:hypothetical protein
MNATTAPAEIEELQDFLSRAAQDALGRAGDPFNRTPLTTAFADAEVDVIARLAELVTTDEQARAFVRRWRELVENTDEYPQRRGARLPSSCGWEWSIGAQLLRAAVTLFDALVADDIVKGYTVLGTVVED